MSSIYWSYTSKNYQRSYDVIVIGAGYVGLSTAYFLKKEKPELRVMIIEKDHVGAGASGRNAGFLTKGSLLFYAHLFETWGKEKAIGLYNYAHESIHKVVQDLALVESGVATPTSSWTFVRSDSVHKRITALPVDLLKNFNQVSVDKVPMYQNSAMKNIFNQAEEFSVNPQRLLALLEQKVREMGVDFILGAQVERITSESIPVIETSYGSFSCDKLAICTNGYSYLLPELGLNIVPQRAQMLAMKLDRPIFENGLFYDPEERVYFKFDRPGHLLIGGKRLVDEKNENTADLNVSAKIQDALSQYVKNELNLSGEKMASWAGIMGFTSTEIPYVGELANLKSCFVAAGFSGHGMGWGFKTAQELSLCLIGKMSQPQLAQYKK